MIAVIPLCPTNRILCKQVLVMEWVDGFRLTDSTSLATNGLETKKLVDTLVQCSLQQILENGCKLLPCLQQGDLPSDNFWMKFLTHFPSFSCGCKFVGAWVGNMCQVSLTLTFAHDKIAPCRQSPCMC